MNLKPIAIASLSLLLATHAYAVAAIDTNSTTQMPSAEQIKQKGEAFLKQNKSQKGVVTLSDGLQYKVIKQGKGPKPTANDIVSVEYEGRLIDGTEFDSSKKHGGPVSFGVNQVIPGWTEALQLMPVGSTWEIYIPSNLAYGEQGVQPSIGPNEPLIFKVTLVEIKKS